MLVMPRFYWSRFNARKHVWKLKFSNFDHAIEILSVARLYLLQWLLVLLLLVLFNRIKPDSSFEFVTNIYIVPLGIVSELHQSL